ncbi:MAG: hypothetical protein ACI9C4_002634 [Paraglaciecola sp.]|jgi:hypothetical protein
MDDKNEATKSSSWSHTKPHVLCGDPIIIKNGGKKFGGRYVGKCTLAPSEHVFIFDHLTKRGLPARGIITAKNETSLLSTFFT